VSASAVNLAGLAPLDVPARWDRVRAEAAERGCDALVVSHLVNVRWLSGFTGSNAVLVVGDDPVLITDGRYGEQATAQAAAAGVEVRIEVTTTDVLARVRAALGSARRVGLEAARISWAEQRRYVDALDAVELVPTDGVVEAARQVKDAGEIARLEVAAEVCDRALAEVMPLLLERPTEATFGLELDTAMRRLGADQPSFDTIVASGANSARPHHHPGPRPIEHGDLVVIDVGARVEGYGSDMTRTVVVGAEPDPDQARWWEAVRESQAAGVAEIRPGAEIRTVDAACRRVLSEHGLADLFVHGTGHGIGLEIHEDPFVNGRAVGILRPGLVITVEPGVYVTGRGGVRIEDSLVVTEDGCRPITRSPKLPSLA
jgi:Xaa-Pro aminopeptidase